MTVEGGSVAHGVLRARGPAAASGADHGGGEGRRVGAEQQARIHLLAAGGASGLEGVGHRAGHAAAPLQQLLVRPRAPHDVVIHRVGARPDREDARALVEGDREGVQARAAAADVGIVRAVGARLGAQPAGAGGARHHHVAGDGGVVGEGHDLAGVAALRRVVGARVVADGGAAAAEDGDAGAVVVGDHVALDQEPTGLADHALAAVAGGITVPAALDALIVLTETLGAVENDAVPLGRAGALAPAGRIRAVTRLADAGCAVAAVVTAAAAMLRPDRRRIDPPVPRAGGALRGVAGAHRRHTERRRIVVVVADHVVADDVHAFAPADRTPEVDGRRPAVGVVVLDQVVLEGDRRGAEREERAAAVVAPEDRVLHGDVLHRPERPVEVDGILGGNVLGVGRGQAGVVERPVGEGEAADDGLEVRRL